MNEATYQHTGQPFPPECAFALIPGEGSDPCPTIIKAFEQSGFHVTRDIIISTPDTPGHLAAQAGDFWFHTDGVFLDLPPRWVLIQLLEASEGGVLHVLNADSLRGEMPEGDVLFGRPDRGVKVPLVAAVDGRQVFRYRQDYMHQLPGGADLDTAHRVVRDHAARHSILLGSLTPYDCLVTDNWQVMHRRENFVGRRVIRRVWLG